METILSIEEFEGEWKDGYKITTNNQDIKLMIDNGQSCCEIWGYFISEDDFDKFIGSNILKIRLTDEMNKNIDLNDKVEEWLITKDGNLDLYNGGCMFVDIVTNVGVLQFVAYNEHNGYYGHEACVISTQLNHKTYL